MMWDMELSMSHICRGCSQPFTPRSNGGKPQRFCSRPCRMAYASAHRWDGYVPKVGPCVVCNRPTASRSGVCVCDTDECRRGRAEQRGLERRNGAVAVPIEYFTCKNCGALFVGKARKNRLYCTRDCAHMAGQRTYKHRRRTAERTGDFITIFDLGERDGWRCHICGKKIKLRAGGAPMSPSIDHLIPIVDGGHHVWANVAIAHKRCNSQRRTGGLVQLRID